MKKILIGIITIFFLASASPLHAKNIGVPAECEDVMLQGFYWDSYQTTSKYGGTGWNRLIKDTAAITRNFDLIWLPPSAYAGDNGGMGYYHVQLSDQDSKWGKATALSKLIAAFHRGGTKVLADIVINHRNDAGKWTNFAKDYFGPGYGTFELTQEHICSGDEAFWTSGSPAYGSSVHGAEDTGTNDGGCRDLDHSSEYVQNWAKTYVRWMIDSMKYDGFRYDMTRGYSGQYLSMYNEAAQPYLSVSEFWTGISDILSHLYVADYNTMVFDFPLKYVLNEAISEGKYGRLKRNANSLRGQGKSRYAVTFIDNHDTFERAEEDACNQEFMGCKVDLNNASIKNAILQANAYILMMPGVPCVFYPHWAKYKEQISALIAVRKLAGIHSESAVSNESGSNSKPYEGTIQGHRGRVILRIGADRSKDAPEGYHLALEGSDMGSDFTIFVSDDVVTGVEDVRRDDVRCTKVMKDGRLYLKYEGRMYDVRGHEVR